LNLICLRSLSFVQGKSLLSLRATQNLSHSFASFLIWLNKSLLLSNYRVIVALLTSTSRVIVALLPSIRRVIFTRVKRRGLKIVSFSGEIFCIMRSKYFLMNSLSEKRFAFLSQQVRDTITCPQLTGTITGLVSEGIMLWLNYRFLRTPLFLISEHQQISCTCLRVSNVHA